MPQSQLSVCNRALALAKARTRLAAIDDTTEAGYHCGLFYDDTRTTALRAAHWNFAQKQTALAIDKSADPNADAAAIGEPPFPWVYSFQLPADFIAARWVDQAPDTYVDIVPIFPNQQAAPYLVNKIPYQLTTDSTVGYRIMVCQSASPLLTYTFDADDPSTWDTMFDSAVVNGLAAQLAMALSGDDGLAKMRMDAANQSLLQARVADANEGTTIIDNTPDWMSVRGIPQRNEFVTFPSYGPVFAFL